MEIIVLYSGKLHRGTTRLIQPVANNRHTVVTTIWFENLAGGERTATLFLNTKTPKRKLPKRFLFTKIKIPAGNRHTIFTQLVLFEGDYLSVRTWRKTSIPCFVGGFQVADRTTTKETNAQ
jgi:hypothetical protein